MAETKCGGGMRVERWPRSQEGRLLGSLLGRQREVGWGGGGGFSLGEYPDQGDKVCWDQHPSMGGELGRSSDSGQ